MWLKTLYAGDAGEQYLYIFVALGRVWECANRSQVDIVGQLGGQMAEMVGAMVETVGEEPELESEGFMEQHDEDEEELTRVKTHTRSL